MTYITGDDKCVEISVSEIRVDQAGSCSFDAGGSCAARHGFTVDALSLEEITSYSWATSLGSIISGGDSSSVVIDITSNRHRIFTVYCTISNGYVTGTVSYQFDSLHNVIPICIHANTDGTWYGYEYGSFGSITDEYLDTGELIYSRKWNLDGEMRFEFGVDGLLQLTDVDTINIYYLGVLRTATWDGFGYVIYDTTMIADAMIDYNTCGRDFCMSMYFLPTQVIGSDFKELTDG